MEASKIILSEAEHRLISNADIILTKNSAIDKLVNMFGELVDQYRNIAATGMQQFPQHFSVHPKISKGEKYRDLPWVMLDYPRTFSNEDGHFACRSFFWWGQFFSFSVQISGKYLEAALPLLETHLPAGWFTGITENPWNHELPNDEWLPVPGKEWEHLAHPHLKMAKKIPIGQWELVTELFAEYFTEIYPLITTILSTNPVK